MIYIVVLELPGLVIGMTFLLSLIRPSHSPQSLPDIVVSVLIMLVGFGVFALWVALVHEKIEVDATYLVRTSILGRKCIPLSEILSARCGTQGRGNTLLIVETKHGRRRMGMSLPTKTIQDLAELLNSRGVKES